MSLSSPQVRADAPAAATPLLTVRDLRVDLHRPGRTPVAVIDGVDLSIARGQRVALVGESGSGKSVTATAVMGLLDAPLSARAEAVILGTVDLQALSPAQWRAVRGRSIGLVQQDPLTALSPVFTVGSQIAETLRRHLGLGRREARARATACLSDVGVPQAARRYDDYPHQLSGGLRQRVAIAMALACSPSLLLADEPTTALDVTVQAQVMDLLLGLSERTGTGVLFITHDLGVLPGFADAVAVMYAGCIVEHGECGEVLARPQHPYTAALLAAQPGRRPGTRKRRLTVIPGLPPPPERRPAGCSFAPRCPIALERCRQEVPALRLVEGHPVACHRAGETGTDPVEGTP